MVIHLGYLAYDRTFRTAFIPNEEIRQELILATKRKKWNELIVFQKESDKQLKRLTELGFGDLPVCMAKNQYSLSDDPTLLGRPSGFELNVREVYVSAGAGFVVVLTGAVMTMPGLPKAPAAYNIDVDDSGRIVGLF